MNVSSVHMDDLPQLTTNPDEIKLWAESHQAVPEIMNVQNGQETLRLNFPGTQDDIFLGETTNEKEIDWDNFFEKFNDLELAFQYNPQAEGIDLSNEYKFIKRSEIKM